MFRVKICGITSVEDALGAAEAGADALGLNFYEPSPRYVTTEQAQEIAAAVRKEQGKLAPRVVGVFVNADWDQLMQALAAADLDAIQLHGEETPEFVGRLNMLNVDIKDELPWWTRVFLPADQIEPTPIIRAFRCRAASLLDVSNYLKECRLLGKAEKRQATFPQAVLLDAFSPGSYGGTGQVVDWETVQRDREMLLGVPLILAGGLTPDNVAQAIRTCRPDGVDTASGVESSPGKKDPAKVRDFLAAAKGAFGDL